MKRLKLTSWIALISFSLAMLLPFLPVAEMMSHKALDTTFRHRRGRVPGPAIALVGIDEESLQVLPEPLALWHRHLASVMEGLAQAQARAVALDITLPDHSYEHLIPGGDAALAGALLELKASCPVAIAITVDSQGRFRPMNPCLQAAVGPENLGMDSWPMDQDGVVRRHPRQIEGELPTLAGDLARQLGAKVSEGILDFSLGESLDYIPIHQVVAWQHEGNMEQLKRHFQGRIVLVGSVLPFMDQVALPVNLAAWKQNASRSPGVLLHAQALRTFLGPGPIRELPPLMSAVLILGLAVSLWLAGRSVYLGTSLFLASMGLLLLAGWRLLESRWMLPVPIILLGGAIGLAGRFLSRALERLRERRILRKAFEGYLSPSVLQGVLSGRVRVELAGEHRFAAILFADIRDFTPLCESEDPVRIVNLLNRFFTLMTAAVHEHRGTLVQYTGDGLMALFGGPEAIEEPCLPAFHAAQAMLSALDRLNGELESEGQTPLRIGIGLHAGQVAIGHVGSSERFQYGAVGDVVNAASRLEGLSKELGYPLILSETVMAGLVPRPPVQDLGHPSMKGHAPMRVFGGPIPIPSEELPC